MNATSSSLKRLSVIFLILVSLTHPGISAAQVGPELRERVAPAAVSIALIVEVADQGETFRDYLPIGSGTVVSPNGILLTNWHVVDLVSAQEELAILENQLRKDRPSLKLTIDASQFVILETEGISEPRPTFLAEIVAHDEELDLAVLRIIEDIDGTLIAEEANTFPFIPLGDSSKIAQGDPIYIFSYPGAGGSTLTYTEGVVSGFNYEEGIDGPAWVTTDATISGGSSGGTAVDASGQLIGIPTFVSSLDCRPGDTNFDGLVDAADLGCIPVGGSFGMLRPIDIAKPLLARMGYQETEAVSTPEPGDVSVDTDQPDRGADERSGWSPSVPSTTADGRPSCPPDFREGLEDGYWTPSPRDEPADGWTPSPPIATAEGQAQCHLDFVDAE